MHSVIFVALAFVLGCLTILAPRPIPRTAFLSAFTGLIFAGLDVSLCAIALAILASGLLVIDLYWYREPKPADDIGDRQTASATLDDDEDLAPETSVHLTAEERHARR